MTDPNDSNTPGQGANDQQPQAPTPGQAPTAVPQAPQPGQAPTTPQVPDTADLPEKLRGKSASDIAKMYTELEKKAGEHAAKIGEVKKAEEGMQIILQAIYSDPNLAESVKQKIAQQQGVSYQGNGQPTPQRDSAVKLLEQQVTTQFERDYGIAALPPEKKQEMRGKIGNALAELVDPGGTKSYQEILDSIPLDKLPKFLENAYIVANRDEIAEGGKLEGLRLAHQNRMAMINSMPSGSVPPDNDVKLTAAERAVAQKMGIPEDKYLARKIEIAKSSPNTD